MSVKIEICMIGKIYNRRRIRLCLIADGKRIVVIECIGDRSMQITGITRITVCTVKSEHHAVFAFS